MMSDEQLINEMAELWVANGGDAEGIAFNWQRIQQAVQDKMETGE
jgi:hypothetical protein